MSNICEKPFGTAINRQARLFVIDSGLLKVGLSDLGCTVVFIEAKDKRGKTVNTVFGYDDAEGYLKGSSFHGATVGRYAGRIGGARFTLSGREYRLEPNDGKNHLHGGFNKRFWDAEPVSNGVRFSLISPDMDEGFPGKLWVAVTAEVEKGTLRLTYEASCSEDTVINLTGHSYFNLEGSKSVKRHLLWVNSDRYAEVDPALIPTGDIINVAGTPLDHREPIPLSKAIKSPLLRATRGIDHSFILDGTEKDEAGLFSAARLYSPRSGIMLTCRTTQPSIHVYTAGFADKDACGSFRRNCGVCLEAQHLPDSPNKPSFPSTVLKKGELFREVTEYEFETVN